MPHITFLKTSAYTFDWGSIYLYWRPVGSTPARPCGWRGSEQKRAAIFAHSGGPLGRFYHAFGYLGLEDLPRLLGTRPLSTCSF